MKHVAPRLVIALAILALLVTGSALAEPTAPAAGTPEATILAGLKLIRDGKFDAWMAQHCHQGDLCHNNNARKSLKKYNLPAMQRVAPDCIKAGDKLEITRVDGNPATDEQVKVFALCNPKGMPRPFTMKKEGSAWKFRKI
jgi:hypothetical protein